MGPSAWNLSWPAVSQIFSSIVFPSKVIFLQENDALKSIISWHQCIRSGTKIRDLVNSYLQCRNMARIEFIFNIAKHNRRFSYSSLTQQDNLEEKKCPMKIIFKTLSKTSIQNIYKKSGIRDLLNWVMPRKTNSSRKHNLKP